MIEVWGGVECTLNRVGDSYLNQLRMSGHMERASDLDLFHALGIRTLRFPVLWEQHAPDSPDEIDWEWADRRLGRLQELGIKPIVGFVHHGSGPRYTDLLDPEFAAKLAFFAERFAARYPWVEAYTPINEPLTTARFSGLYGIWFPHHRDTKSFLRILWHECLATRAVMKAVRAVNPRAEFIQTEDLGRISSTKRLAYQADFENHRRWLGFDILCGRFQAGHPLYAFCLAHGLKEEEIRDFALNPCPPDIFGINHYVTSNRFLDDRLEFYPPAAHGGNGRHAYADVEAVRADEAPASPAELLEEVWLRYKRPIAVTEVHIGCTREEQMRWLRDIHEAASALRQRSIPIRAITPWSLLGSFDWNNLVTAQNGSYESGVFDLRTGSPRPTQLAKMIKAYAQGETFDHPALDMEGWWRRPERLLIGVERPGSASALASRVKKPRPILITGGEHKLARAFVKQCELRALPHRIVRQDEFERLSEAEVDSRLRELKPWAIIHAAAYAKDDGLDALCELSLQKAVRTTGALAQYCADTKTKLLHFSSEHVFDGAAGEAYTESSAKNPLNLYGRTQNEAEDRLSAIYPEALTIRTSTLFDPWDEDNILHAMLRQLARGENFPAPNDFIVSPTYLPEFCERGLDIFLDDERGIWHLTNASALSWAAFMRMVLAPTKFDPNQIQEAPPGQSLRRPAYAPLRSERGQLLRGLEEAIDSFHRDSEFRFFE